jgi:hypothetical protein
MRDRGRQRVDLPSTWNFVSGAILPSSFSALKVRQEPIATSA